MLWRLWCTGGHTRQVSLYSSSCCTVNHAFKKYMYSIHVHILEPSTTAFVNHPPPPHTQHPGSSQLSSLRGREDGLRAELLTTQRENMTLRFDYEQAILELPRLKVKNHLESCYVHYLFYCVPTVQSRLNDQQLYIEALKSSGAGDNVRPITSKQVRVHVCTMSCTCTLHSNNYASLIKYMPCGP